MKLWLIGGILVGLLGVSLYLAAVKRSAPTPDVAIVLAEEPKPVPTPLAMQQVVDVTNIEPLLDPPTIPASEAASSGPVITRVGYEEGLPVVQSPVDVKPIPKALEDEVFRSEPGALLLDGDAVTSPRIQPRKILEAYLAGEWDYDQPPSVAKPTAFEVHAKATSLAPLFFLSDSDLLERGSIAKAQRESALRATSLQTSASQAPTSRLDWYTRWYGNDRLPMSFAPAILDEQPRKKSEQEERRELFSFWIGVMSWN